MSFAARCGEIRSSAAAGCDRLVHPQVRAGAERETQTRLIGALLAGPFLIAAAVWMLLPADAGIAVALAVICACFGAAWSCVLAVVTTGRATAVMAVALLLSAIAVAGIIVAAGGIASPAALLSMALPVEAWLVCRTRRAFQWGSAAALAALGLQFVTPDLFLNAAGPAAWHWMLPLAYAATLVPRLGALLDRQVIVREASAYPELETVIGGVVVRLGAGGEVVDVAEAARVQLGLEPELLHGSGLFDRIHVADRITYLCALADLRDGATARRVEFRMRLPQTAVTVADRYGDFAIEFAKQDARSEVVTGLIRDNSEIADLRAKLLAASEVNDQLDMAKSRFLAAVSHELRTPLNSIIGFSDMLLHEMFGGFGDPRQKEYIEIVRDSGHHLLAVVNSILDVSKMEAGSYATNPEPFRFHEAVDMCGAMMSVQADAKTISVVRQIGPEIGEIRADRRAVQQMLINLVSNAVKFTPEGGTVTIGAKRLGSRVHFWVSDTGIGISDVDLQRVGRPFTQVQNDYNRQYEGTGLGLSLVKGLVALHDGTMTMDSALGDGTTVTITLPVDGPGGAPGRDGAAVLPMKSARKTENVNGTLRKAG